MAANVQIVEKGPCIICLAYGGDMQRVFPTGLATIRQRAEEKGESDVLLRIFESGDPIFIHRGCRRNHLIGKLDVFSVVNLQ